MQFTDKDVVFRSSDSFFTNSKALFITYYDLLNVPWFAYICAIRNQKCLYDLLKLSDIGFMNTNELLAWYMNREYQNPLKTLWIGDESEYDSLDEFLMSEMTSERATPLYNLNYDFLTIQEFLFEIVKNKFCENIVVYTPEENKYVKEEMDHLYGDKVSVKFGNMDDIISKLPTDTTYMSNSTDILESLLRTNHLDFSSVAVPYDYSYNFKKDGSLKYDVEKLSKDHVFKFNLFNAIRG